MTSEDFRAALTQIFSKAAKAGRGTVVVKSGELHRIVGGYPGTHHRMPVCCDVMYAEMIDGVDEILASPPKGKGASLTIEYILPRPARW